jgi:hypothetical protein
MPGVNQSGEPMRVVVAGGGIAALEVLAGLRALAGERVAATLLSLSDSFSYRPLSTAVPFTFRDERTRRLDELAGGLGAAFVHDGLAHVDTARGRVLTHDGDLVSYDRLVVAVGARPAPAAAGQRWARGAEGMRLLTRLLRELEDEATRSVAFIVPPNAAWPIDAYELSLVASLAVRRARGLRRGRRHPVVAEAQRPGRRPGDVRRRGHSRGGRGGASNRAGGRRSSTASSPCRRTSPAPPGSPWLDDGEPLAHCLWWPPGHVSGR